MPPSDHDIREIHLSLERQYAKIQSILARLTALESRPCNCSAASSAGSGGTTTSPSDASFERPKTTPTTSSTTSAPAAAVASDPVSAAKAKPHAETAEEVVQPPKEIARYADALRWTPTSRVYVDWNKTYYVYPSRLALLRTDTEPVNCVHPEEKVIEKGCALVPNVTAIKREMGEA